MAGLSGPARTFWQSYDLLYLLSRFVSHLNDLVVLHANASYQLDQGDLSRLSRTGRWLQEYLVLPLYSQVQINLSAFAHKSLESSTALARPLAAHADKVRGLCLSTVVPQLRRQTCAAHGGSRALDIVRILIPAMINLQTFQ